MQMQRKDILQDYLTVREAAKYLSMQLGIKINRARLDTWRARERGPAWMRLPNGQILYRKEDLDAYCLEHGHAVLAYERRKAPQQNSLLVTEPPADEYIRADRLLAQLALHAEGISQWDERQLLRYLDSYDDAQQPQHWQGHAYVPAQQAATLIAELIDDPATRASICSALGLQQEAQPEQQPGDLPLPWP